MRSKVIHALLLSVMFWSFFGWGDHVFAEPNEDYSAPQNKGFFESIWDLFSLDFVDNKRKGLKKLAYKSSLTEEERNNPKMADNIQQSAESTLVDNLIEMTIQDDKNKKLQVQKFYDKYRLSHYSLDMVLENTSYFDLVGQAANTGHYYFHQFNNGIWTMNLVFSRIVVWVLENALELDIINEAGESISHALKTLAGFNGVNLTERGIYGVFFPLMIVLLGAWVGWKALMKDDSDGATRGLIHSFVIIFLTFFFFYFSQTIITKANEVSSEVTKGVMAISTNMLQPTKKALNSDEATIAAANNLWGILVHQPYLLLQYGNTHVKSERVHELLKNNPQSEGRAKATKTEVSKEKGGYKNINMLPQNNSIRLGFIIMVSLLNLVVGAMVILLAAGLPFFQMYFMIVVLLAPIALAWAIVPAWEEAAYSWASELLGALMMKLALGILLSIYFALSGSLYSFADDEGYVMIMFLQFLLTILIIWRRQMIFDLVISPTKYLTSKMPGTARVMDNVLDSGKKAMGAGTKLAGKMVDHALDNRRASSLRKSIQNGPTSYKDPDEEAKKNEPKYSLNRDTDADVSGSDDDNPPPPSGELTLANIQNAPTEEENTSDDDQNPPPPPTFGELGDHRLKLNESEEESDDSKGNPPPDDQKVKEELPSLMPTVGNDDDNGDSGGNGGPSQNLPIVIQDNAKYSLFKDDDDQEGKDDT